jgi:RIO kinase 1
MEPLEAEEAFRQSVANLKLMVGAGRVHGDYSAYNILWHNGKAVIIDFPQVIEFNNNPNAQAFLERDVRSLCKSFRNKGVKADEEKLLKEVRECEKNRYE